MKTRTIAIAALLVFAASVIPAFSGTCMMWKAASTSATVYLLGSLHVTTPEMYPLPREVEDAFARSDTLVVEVNMNKLDQQKLFTFIGEKGVYQDGQTLPASISTETWEGTKAALDQLGIPLTGVEKLKPWYVGMSLMMGQLEKLGYDPKLGIDQHFLDLATRRKKRVDELETADFQMNLFARGDDRRQEEELVSTLAEIKGMKGEMATLVEAWIAGDASAIDAVLSQKLEDHPESRDFVNELIYDRNAPMAAKIEGYLKGTGTTFVVVGCAHVVGDKGIAKTLQDHRYAVDQCRVEAAKTKGNTP